MSKYQVDRNHLMTLVEKIPAFPQSVNRILEITSSADCAPKEVVSVIEHDPVLTMKLLKMVNSSYFGLSKEVSSVKQAVVYVGLNTVKNVAITMATVGSLPKKNKAGLESDDLWMHCLKVGVIARMIAQDRGIMRNDLAGYFVAGLLHDIGKMVCAEYLPEAYSQVLQKSQEEPDTPFWEIERSIMDIDHAEVGGVVAEKWGLPADLIRAIQAHHQISAEDAENPLVLAIAFANHAAHVSDAVAKGEEVGPVYSNDKLAPEVIAWSGEFDEALARLTEIEAEVEKAQAFMRMSQ